MPLFHVWFSTKRRRWLLQGEVAEAAKTIIERTAKEKGIALLECQPMVNHVHLLLDMEDVRGLSLAMNNLKGISSRRLSQQFPDLKEDAGVPAIWQHRYAFKPVPEAARERVAEYIRSQWDRLDKYER